MHEMAIAAALIEQICDHAVRVGAVRVAEINIRMGVQSGIARSLHFCFPSASRDTLCEGAVLNIEEVPLTVLCTHCAAVKRPSALYNFRCPDCGYPTPKVLTGREMQLMSIGLVPPNAQHAAARPGTMPPRERKVTSTKNGKRSCNIN
jgi:hydrogenase nickel incorporation protein HypA/HybF